MNLVECAKALNISVEQFFNWSYQRAGHLYPKDPLPDKAYLQYKYYGFLPKYVVSQMRSLKLSATFERIRQKYQQPS